MTTPQLHAQGSVLPGTSCSDCYSQPPGGEWARPRPYTMRRLNLFIALLAALILPLGGLMAAAPAMAYNVSAVYKDCEGNGKLTGHYPRGELQAALNSMPSEVAEYSACSDIIQQALLGASAPGGGHHGGSSSVLGGAGRNRGGGGPGGAASGGRAGSTGTSSTNGGRSAGAGTPNAVRLAGSDIRPGSTGTGAAGSSLPVALLVVLILLALTAFSGGAFAIRRRVVARQGT